MEEKKFNENDIRPKNLMKGQAIAAAIDLGRLLIKTNEFVEVGCPACESKDYKKKYSKSTLTFVECSYCQTIFTNPRPTDKVLSYFYKDSVNYAYWNTHIFPASEQVRREKIFVPRVDKVEMFCKKYSIPMNSLLEVGAGFGTFCLELKKRNIFEKVVAVEPTPSLAETCRQKVLEVIEDVIENISFKEEEKFDVIVSFEVIEHLYCPKDFIVKCSNLLKNGGLLILTCPNGQGFDFIVLGEKCNNLDYQHLNYFNPKSLKLLLENSGFEVLESLTPGKLDADLVRTKILEGEFDISQQPFLKKVLIDEWEKLGDKFQKFLADNGLSSNMWVVARKII
jgi:2-polyprenyl-3-methyl-5-hydroxy-6-metoxy-1,4-benzoquinol methylase/ribosomal protein S27E